MSTATVSKVTVGPKHYSRMRSQEHKCLEFVVKWQDGDVTTEPIYHLIDVDTEEVNEKLIPILAQYLEVVRVYPCTPRKCWFCNTKCCKGKSLCSGHDSIGKKWLFDLIKAENSLRLVADPLWQQGLQEQRRLGVIPKNITTRAQASRWGVGGYTLHTPPSPPSPPPPLPLLYEDEDDSELTWPR